MVELADPDTLMLIDSAAGILSARARLPVDVRGFDPAISVIADRAGFDALEAEWTQLEQAAVGATLFQSFAWCRAVFNHHGQHRQPFSPLVLLLRESGRLVGLLPLQRASGLARVATGFGEPYQQYSDVLILPDSPSDTAARLLDAALHLPGIDGLSLLKVRDDSALAPLLKTRGAIRSNADAAPFVDLRPYPDFAAYLSTVNAKTRKNMRNAKNRLARTGTLGHRVLSEPAEIAALVARAHAGRERWLAHQGLTSRAFRDPTFGAFSAAVA